MLGEGVASPFTINKKIFHIIIFFDRENMCIIWIFWIKRYKFLIQGSPHTHTTIGKAGKSSSCYIAVD